MFNPDFLKAIAMANRSVAGGAFAQAVKPPRMLIFADYYHERIQLEIEEYEKTLNEDQELAIEVPLIDGTRILVQWFGYRNPNMIIIVGRDGKNNDVRVLIPHTDIHIIMTKRDVPAKQKKNRIGFQARRPEADA
ncbi:MAG: hypothetical protein ACR2HX_16135 [Pyrinomonadaceae bacterium]